MKLLVRSRMLWLILASAAAFLATMQFVAAEDMIVVVRALSIWMAASCAWIWYPLWWPPIRLAQSGDSYRLGLGVFLLCLGVIINGGASLASRVGGTAALPEVFAFGTFLLVLSLGLLVSTPGDKEEHISYRSWRVIGAAIAIGGLCAGLTIAATWSSSFVMGGGFP